MIEFCFSVCSPPRFMRLCEVSNSCVIAVLIDGSNNDGG